MEVEEGEWKLRRVEGNRIRRREGEEGEGYRGG
jgi:hypothetical protein